MFSSFRPLTSLAARNTRLLSHTSYIALGSNISPRYPAIAHSLELIEALPSTTLKSTSKLYETPPMYVTDQSTFLNAVVEISTDLSPEDLLKALKNIETTVGRTVTKRNGPRVVDCDILTYADPDGTPVKVDIPPSPTAGGLEIPHPRINEREFVLRPLADLAKATFQAPLDRLHKHTPSTAVAVLPLPNDRLLHLNKSLVMGILNVTPDSFSDGGENDTIPAALQSVANMLAEGADLIDVGGESTRPGADEVPAQTEIARVVPIIEAIRRAHPNVVISIDTRRAAVARAAVDAGACFVNDVSGGVFDPLMFQTVAALQVPMCILHSRGTPKTMQGLANYEDVVVEVAKELMDRSKDAQKEGVHRWLQVLDIGIGFAKTHDQTLELLSRSAEFPALTDDLPLLIGTSRKGFIGTVTGEAEAKERDFGTVAAHLKAMEGGTTRIARVHNVKGMVQAARIFDAIAASGAKSPTPAPTPEPTSTPAPPSPAPKRDATARRPTVVCDPYENNGKPLSRAQIEDMLPTISSSWTLADDALSLHLAIPVGSYLAGATLLKTVAAVSFNNNHYGTVSLERRLVKKQWQDVLCIKLQTTVLSGLSFQDFLLATLIDSELAR